MKPLQSDDLDEKIRTSKLSWGLNFGAILAVSWHMILMGDGSSSVLKIEFHAKPCFTTSSRL